MEFGLPFIDSKTGLLYFKPDKFEINLFASVKMNGI